LLSPFHDPHLERVYQFIEKNQGNNQEDAFSSQGVRMTFAQTEGQTCRICFKDGDPPQNTPISTTGEEFDAIRTQNLNDPGRL
jgi:hypothetical protein